MTFDSGSAACPTVLSGALWGPAPPFRFLESLSFAYHIFIHKNTKELGEGRLGSAQHRVRASGSVQQPERGSSPRSPGARECVHAHSRACGLAHAPRGVGAALGADPKRVQRGRERVCGKRAPGVSVRESACPSRPAGPRGTKLSVLSWRCPRAAPWGDLGLSPSPRKWQCLTP